MNREMMIDWLNDHVETWDENRSVIVDSPMPDPWLTDFPVGMLHFRVVNIETEEVIYRRDCHIKGTE